MGDAEKLAVLSERTYKDQAVWFLNAFWDKFSEDAERLWLYVQSMETLDINKKAEGNGLDEAQAHRFLEKFNETMTVQSMRDSLRKSGAVPPKGFKLVPLIHLLIVKYNADWKYLVNAPQGSKEEIAKAQKLLDEVTAAFQEADARAQEAKEALRIAQAREADAKAREAEARASEADAKAKENEAIARKNEAIARENEARDRENEAIARENEAREREAPFKAAQEEVNAALADVKAQETARDNTTEELKRKSNEGGVVQQNKAKAELAQHLAKDPLPLSKAKITLEAALKKAEKARAPFDQATKQAEQARAAATEAAEQASAARAVSEKAAKQAGDARAKAEDARRVAEKAAQQASDARAHSEEAKHAAEAALDEASRRLEEAEEYLEQAKKTLPEGQIWWINRELQEKRKYLPERKGGIKKT